MIWLILAALSSCSLIPSSKTAEAKVRIIRTTTTTIYSTTTEIALTGSFVATYNIVEITNQKGSFPSFFMTLYDRLEYWSDTWMTRTITTRTETIIGKQ